MPSSEDCLEARQQVWEWAVEQLVLEGHPKHSAEEIVKHMSYESRVEKAEKLRGPIYRGAGFSTACGQFICSINTTIMLITAG